MKKRFSLIMALIFILLNSNSFAAATSGADSFVQYDVWLYAGIIVLLLATVGVICYEVYTYFRRK